jgi:hypothetical protein
MRYLTSWEKIAFKQGFQAGFEEGFIEAAKDNPAEANRGIEFIRRKALEALKRISPGAISRAALKPRSAKLLHKR